MLTHVEHIWSYMKMYEWQHLNMFEHIWSYLNIFELFWNSESTKNHVSSFKNLTQSVRLSGNVAQRGIFATTASLWSSDPPWTERTLWRDCSHLFQGWLSSLRQWIARRSSQGICSRCSLSGCCWCDLHSFDIKPCILQELLGLEHLCSVSTFFDVRQHQPGLGSQRRSHWGPVARLKGPWTSDHLPSLRLIVKVTLMPPIYSTDCSHNIQQCHKNDTQTISDPLWPFLFLSLSKRPRPNSAWSPWGWHVMPSKLWPRHATSGS